MKTTTGGITVVGLVTVAVAIALFFLYKRQSGHGRVSRFGQYQGYSEAAYDGNERRSEYMTLKDGTRLAYDLILPTKDGAPTDEPLPVLFKYTPYLRTFTIFDEDGNNIIADLFDMKWYEKAMLRFRNRVYDQGHLMDPVFRTKHLETLLRHGYAVVVVERPGTGASFGVTNPSFSFQAGSRIRITVAFADADNFDTPILDPAPEIKVLRDANHASFIEIPMIPAR